MGRPLSRLICVFGCLLGFRGVAGYVSCFYLGKLSYKLCYCLRKLVPCFLLPFCVCKVLFCIFSLAFALQMFCLLMNFSPCVHAIVLFMPCLRAAFLPTYLFAYLSAYLSLFLSCESFLFVCLFVCLFVFLFVCFDVIFIYLFIFVLFKRSLIIMGTVLYLS